MINMIAGEHIPGSKKFNNVYARYRLDSGKTSPAIFRPIKYANQIFLKQDSGRTSPAIESIAGEHTTVLNFFYPGSHMIRSEHMKSCLAAKIRFMLFKGPGSLKIFLQSAEMLTN